MIGPARDPDARRERRLAAPSIVIAQAGDQPVASPGRRTRADVVSGRAHAGRGEARADAGRQPEVVERGRDHHVLFSRTEGEQIVDRAHPAAALGAGDQRAERTAHGVLVDQVRRGQHRARDPYRPGLVGVRVSSAVVVGDGALVITARERRGTERDRADQRVCERERKFLALHEKHTRAAAQTRLWDLRPTSVRRVDASLDGDSTSIEPSHLYGDDMLINPTVTKVVTLDHPALEASSRFIDRALRLVAPVGRGEGVTTLVMMINVFVLLTCYYVLKVVREPLILLGGGGAELKAYASAGQTLLLLAVVPAFGWL